METGRRALNSATAQGNAAASQNSNLTLPSEVVGDAEGGFDPASPDIRVILEQLANGPTDGGYGAGICFELSAHRAVGVGATIDPTTGSLIIDIDTLTFDRAIELRIDCATVFRTAAHTR
ncbi:hypothetical protein Q3O43_29635 (plasmid) [Rhodococcus aetherivorans]|uniref:hypothetical protein n=1 Tax=Rhodococcus aetherivorans TaxID=191292 RepID=UPI0026ED02C0|nr:hypothetical protein [Rhodococcus aetherivorans]WKX02038.1 hypothetical protein Q3O43_29635 [Rhodococcus aetherivorans]